MKKCWFLALVAVGLMGCSDASDDKTCEEQGKVTCNDSCVDACTNGTLNMTTCQCDAAALTCEQQGKVTCNGACVDACTTGTLNMTTCQCDTAALTCEQQGKVTCNGSCVDACTNGTLNMTTCQCDTAAQTCEEKGQVTCGGTCYTKCEDGGIRDEANACACPGSTDVTCEEKNQVTCKGDCVDPCTTGTLNTDTCQCDTAAPSCEDQGKVACGDGCVDPCTTGTLNPSTCQCSTEPGDGKCKANIDCTDPAKPACDVTTGECKADTCKNGNIIAPEICDPTVPESFANLTCENFDSTKKWKEGGKPACNDLCVLSAGTCVEEDVVVSDKCGDGKLDKTKGEECESDADVPQSMTCASINSNTSWTASSKVTCNTATCKFDTSTCIEDVCGNGTSDPGEACDFGRNTTSKAVITEADCSIVDKKYSSGKAKCLNSCKKLDVTSCQEGTQNGIYFCQIQAPTSVVFDAEKTTEKMSVKYAFGSAVDESKMQAELVYGIDFNNKDSWQSKAAVQDANADSFSADLTKQNVEHYKQDEAYKDVVYYTFRVRASESDAWTYCTKSGSDLGTINNNTVATATVSEIVSGNVLAKFDFNDTNKWKGSDPRNGGNGFAADQGTGIIKLEPTISAANWWKCSSNGGCFSGGVTGQSFGIGGCKSSKTEAIDNSGKAVGNHLLISNVNASGVSNINIDMQIKRNDASNSPKNIVIRYSLDGTNYSEVKTLDLPTEDVAFHAIETIALPPAADNCSALSIQLIPFGGSDKLIKFDDIVISKNNE